jgi:parallel beta-helix repeat protein
LTIEPGVVVSMGTGCSLISYSPIIACGTAEQPIVFRARRSWLKWGVIAVVEATSAEFKHVRLEDARHAFINGIDLPGGLSLAHTQATITNCHFHRMYGKDAIYVRHGRVVIRDNLVDKAFKDGIDLDGSSGEIRGNQLVDCDDEGIDLSDNLDVDVRQNTIRDRHGGRIAANRDLDRIRLANILEYSTSH